MYAHSNPTPGDIPRQIQSVMRAGGLDFDAKAKPGDGRTYCLVLDRCPACADRVEAHGGWVKPRTARIAVPTGTLRCDEPLCPAGGAGLTLAAWVSAYSPWASHALVDDDGEVVREVTLAEADREDGALTQLLDDAHLWASEQPGRVAVVNPTPPGVGKSTKAIEKLIERRQGSFLTPRHALADEQRDRFTRTSGMPSRKYDGVYRRLKGTHPVLARKLRPVQDLGFSVRQYVLPDECTQVIDGAGEAAFGVHAHLGAIPVDDHPDPLEPTKLLPGPVIIDELPPMLRQVEIPMEQIALLTGEQVGAETESFARGLAPLARVLVRAGKLLTEQRRQQSRRKNRFPARLHGVDLANVLREAAGGDHQLLEAARASRPTTNAGWFPPPGMRPLGEVYPPKKGDYNWYLQIHYAHATAPAPPIERARSGEISNLTWPHRLTDTAIAALVADVPILRMQAPPGYTACLVVSGWGGNVRVAVELRWRWSWSLASRSSMVILDATAHLVEPALRAAWEGREVKFFRLRVVPPEPKATQRVWVQTSRTAYSRSALLYPRRGNQPRMLRPRGFGTLVRLLDTSVGLMADAQGPGRTLALIVPKDVEPVLRAAIAVSKGELGGEAPEPAQLELVQGDKARRLVECVRGHLGQGRVEKIRLARQLAVSGTNRLESADALVTMPFSPDIGAVTEDARALGVDSGDLIRGLQDAELVQELHRLRPLRATHAAPKLLIHFGDRLPTDWPTGYTRVQAGGRGPVPAYARREAENVVAALARAHGAVSASFIRWAATAPDLYRALPSAHWPLATGVHSKLVAAAALPERTLQRAVIAALPGATARRVANPLPGARGSWTLREVRPGSAAALVNEIQNTLPGMPT